ncbi:MAG: RDD family protein, partial [Bdellovibrionaceae bacterium]|nr:RDD family protein [Pseudobdellovibrionaceae bacterium]
MIIDKYLPENPIIIESNNGMSNIHDSVIGAAFHRGPNKRSGYRLTGWLLASVLTDVLIILSSTCLFLIGASLTFKFSHDTELNQFIKSFVSQKAMKETAFFMYAYISFIYFIFFRVFLGATIGEWSCGIRIGQPNERMKSSYAFKVIFRVLLITGTGILVLPLLSLIFKKDLAGQITKASLYTL